MERVVEPEILDALAADDPKAIRVRHDLRRVNLWMGNAGILTRAYEKHLPERSNLRLAELGTGDGTLLLRVLKRLQRRAGEVWLVDRQNIVSDHTRENYLRAGYRAHPSHGDVFEWLERAPECDCISANLFLHHFQPDQLAELFRKIALRTKLFIVCEPRRLIYARAARRSLWLIGCSDVTRHDAEVSIRAGFDHDELSRLWPKSKEWEIQENRAGLFSHLFVAKRVGV